MSKRRYRTKYLLNRRARRIRRIKFAAALLFTISILAGGTYFVITYLGHNEIHLTKDLKLGDDD
jgi:hypothetical protein